MSNSSYEISPDDDPATGDLPAYSEKDPSERSQMLEPSSETAPLLGYGAITSSQYQAWFGVSAPGGYQNSHVHPPPAVIITLPQRIYENDYLEFSIFTMFCCCFPLGLAAFIFSLQIEADLSKKKKAQSVILTRTRAENQRGNFESARHYSRLAHKLAMIGLKIGLVVLVAVIIILIVLCDKLFFDEMN